MPDPTLLLGHPVDALRCLDCHLEIQLGVAREALLFHLLLNDLLGIIREDRISPACRVGALVATPVGEDVGAVLGVAAQFGVALQQHDLVAGLTQTDAAEAATAAGAYHDDFGFLIPGRRGFHRRDGCLGSLEGRLLGIFGSRSRGVTAAAGRGGRLGLGLLGAARCGEQRATTQCHQSGQELTPLDTFHGFLLFRRRISANDLHHLREIG